MPGDRITEFQPVLRKPRGPDPPWEAAVTVLIHVDDELAVSSMKNCTTKEYLAAAERRVI